MKKKIFQGCLIAVALVASTGSRVASAQTRITIAHPGNISPTSSILLATAQEQGLFTKYGLEVRLIGGSIGTIGLIGKEAEFGSFGTGAFLLDVARQATDLKILGAFVSGRISGQAAKRGRSEGLIVLAQPFTLRYRTQIVNLANNSKLPTMYTSSGFVNAGGLMSYAPSLNDVWRRAATYVDKILRGAKPADLPVEQPTKFELVINLKTAKQIGVTIPPEVLARADKVIK